MLLRNGVSLASNPCWHGGANIYHVDMPNWTFTGRRQNWFAGEGTVISGASIADKNGRPSGAEHPAAWLMPRKGGGLAAFNTIEGAGVLTLASLSLGKDLTASLTGDGTISAASLSLVTQLAATLAGDGSLSGTMQTVASMAAELAGQGDISAALGLIVSMAAALTGSSTLSASNLTGLLGMSAEITSAGDVVVATLTSGERDAIAAALLDLVNAVESGVTLRQAMRGVLAASLGKTSGFVSGASSPVFRNATDSKDRITATVDANGNRTAVTLDLT